MQQCKICGSELPLNASFCGVCGQTFSNTTEEATLIMSADQVSFATSPALISGDAPTLISGAAHSAEGSKALEQSEHTHLPALPAYGDDQPTVVLSNGEKEEERNRRALLGVPLLGLLENVGQGAGNVPAVYGTPPQSGVPMVQGTPPTLGAPSVASSGGPPAPAGSPASHISPGDGIHTSPPTHHLPEHHHPPTHHHPPEHPHPSTHHPPEHPHRPSRHRLPRHGCTVTIILTIVAGIIIFSLIISGWIFGRHPGLTLSGDGHVTWGDDLHVHGSGFPGGISVTLEIDDGSLFSSVDRHSGIQYNDAASANALSAVLFGQRQQTLRPDGTVTVHDDGTFDATIHIGQNWPLGRHLIHAIEKDSSVQVDLPFFIDAKLLPAKLSVNSTTLDFGKVEVGNKPVLSVTLSNAGTQRLDWTADTGEVTWLKLVGNSGSIEAGDAPHVLDVTADTSSLSLGVHQALLNIHSNGGNAQVNVTLVVVASTSPTTTKPAHLTPTASTLDFGSLVAGSVAKRGITLGNDGEQVLRWSASTDGSGWWGIDNSGGSIQPGGSFPLTVTVNTKGLALGTHSGMLTVNSNGGTLTVQIKVNVTASLSPAHLVPPTSINFGSIQQGNAAKQVISIGNDGGQTLNWKAGTDGAGWWGIGNPGGSIQPGGSSSLTVTVNTKGLSLGTHSGMLTISSNGGMASVTVSVTVTAPPQPPCITVKPNSVSFTVKQGQTTGQNVVFTNCGQVVGNVSIVASMSNGSGWLSIMELSGGPIGGPYAPGASQTISIYLDSTKLSPGTYSGAVTATITTNAGLSQAVTVSVTFIVV